jgi:integrase/recombinase XerD
MRGVRRRGSLELPRVVGDPDNIATQAAEYAAWLQTRNFADGTIRQRVFHLRSFVSWCSERGVQHVAEVTKPVLERYQRHLFHHRKADGEPLTFTTQLLTLVALRQFFRHLARSNRILSNPAADLDLPRRAYRLPADALTVEEAERVLAQPDIAKPLGLRDRAILETFYSTGMRRAELAALGLYEVDARRGTALIRQGKGKKDRVVPIGERALLWLGRYRSEVRPELVMRPDPGSLFLNELGQPLGLDWLSIMVRRYVIKAGVPKKGSCHLFRHTAATLMLEGGADVRYVQELLGHSKLESTQLYTQVSIRALKAIHAATHPGAKLERREAAKETAPGLHVAAVDERAALLTSLAAEPDDEDEQP